MHTVRETDFTIRFNLSILSTRNGLLKKYAIVVVETDPFGVPHRAAARADADSSDLVNGIKNT